MASAPHSSTTSSCRKDGIRLIIESSLSDDDVMKNVCKAQDELQAVELALADEGKYLRIVDEGELEKRKDQLERRIRLLQEEGRLMQTLHHQLAGREDERAVAKRADLRQPSFPPVSVKRASSSSNNNDTTTTTAAAAAEHYSPSARVAAAATAAAVSPPSTRETSKCVSMVAPGGREGR